MLDSVRRKHWKKKKLKILCKCLQYDSDLGTCKMRGKSIMYMQGSLNLGHTDSECSSTYSKRAFFGEGCKMCATKSLTAAFRLTFIGEAISYGIEGARQCNPFFMLRWCLGAFGWFILEHFNLRVVGLSRSLALVGSAAAYNSRTRLYYGYPGSFQINRAVVREKVATRRGDWFRENLSFCILPLCNVNTAKFPLTKRQLGSK